MSSLRCDGKCEWNKQWHEGRPVGKSVSWERRAGDVTSERVVQKANRGDGPSCPSAAAAFCWRFSSVIPIQFYGLREFIIQLHLCLLADIERVKPISSRKSKRIHFNYTAKIQPFWIRHFRQPLLTCFRALRAIVWNACSTFMASLALVSK